MAPAEPAEIPSLAALLRRSGLAAGLPQEALAELHLSSHLSMLWLSSPSDGTHNRFRVNGASLRWPGGAGQRVRESRLAGSPGGPAVSVSFPPGVAIISRRGAAHH